MYCKSCDQLANHFKAMLSSASQWYKHCLYQIAQPLPYSCKGNSQSKNGNFLLSAGLCEIQILATRNDSQSPDAHQ